MIFCFLHFQVQRRDLVHLLIYLNLHHCCCHPRRHLRRRHFRTSRHIRHWKTWNEQIEIKFRKEQSKSRAQLYVKKVSRRRSPNHRIIEKCLQVTTRTQQPLPVVDRVVEITGLGITVHRVAAEVEVEVEVEVEEEAATNVTIITTEKIASGRFKSIPRP